MRGVYEASANFSLSANKTVMYVVAPTGKVVELISASVTNATNETNEQLEFSIGRITSGNLGTPTATTITPAPTEVGDQAAASVVKSNVTASEPVYTSGADFGREGCASLAGWRFQPVPEERPTCANGAALGLQLITSPALGSFTADVRMVFREIG